MDTNKIIKIIENNTPNPILKLIIIMLINI